MTKNGFLVFGHVASAMLLSVLLSTWTAHAAPPPVDDTDAEQGDRFGSMVARGDFNGDGYEDLAIGVPDESIGDDFDAYEAGAVEVVYGNSIGLDPSKRQFIRQGSEGVEDKAETYDSFGWSLAAGDFDRDGYDDLAIGVPYEDVGGSEDAGAVNVIYGTASGLSATVGRADQFWHQDVADVEDFAEAYDILGWSLTAGDFNGDGWDDLAIGVPFEDVGIISDDGMVNVIYGSPSGLSALYVANCTLLQGEIHEKGDEFGRSLATGDFDGNGFDDLAVGLPGEDIIRPHNDAGGNAGAVQVFYGSADGFAGGGPFWHQDVSGVEGVAEEHDEFGFSLAAGDFNHDNFSDLAIGVPRETEDAGGPANAGAVNVIYGSSLGLSLSIADQLWHQGLADMEDVAEASDSFGSSLAVGDFNRDKYDDLAIGVNGEDVGSVQEAGAVHLIYGSKAGLDAKIIPNQFWHQDSADIEDAAGVDDSFGGQHSYQSDYRGVTAGDFNGDGYDDLGVGVARENLESAGGPITDAGAVNVIYGSFYGLDATKVVPNQFWTQVFISPPLP